MGRTATPIAERIERQVQYDPNGGCWLWTGVLGPNGYGRIKICGGHGRLVAVHRVTYEHHRGSIPSGLVIDHLCRVRCCCNPAHLEPVTNLENQRRGRSGEWGKAKTHCPHGHAYDAANTRMQRGRRVCRACVARNSREYRRANPAENSAGVRAISEQGNPTPAEK